MMMDQKIEFLVFLCNRYYRSYGVRINFLTLVDYLNLSGLRSESGYEYSCTNFRGVGKLISCVHARLLERNRQYDAESVALTFTNMRGEYAYS